MTSVPNVSCQLPRRYALRFVRFSRILKTDQLALFGRASLIHYCVVVKEFS